MLVVVMETNEYTVMRTKFHLHLCYTEQVIAVKK